MMRRRLDMLQASRGYEQIYDASSGLLPSSSEWDKRCAFGTPSEAVVNGVLEIYNTHIYMNRCYYVVDHYFSDNCYAAVEFPRENEQQIGILLTDGTTAAQGYIDRTGTRFAAHYKSNDEWKGKKTVYIAKADTNIFECYYDGTKAEWYFNDRLVYTQTDLYALSEIATAPRGGTTNPGLFNSRRNGICSSYEVGTGRITKMIYKEF